MQGNLEIMKLQIKGKYGKYKIRIREYSKGILPDI